MDDKVKLLAMEFWLSASRDDDRKPTAGRELRYDALPDATRRDLECAARNILAAKEAMPRDEGAFLDIIVAARIAGMEDGDSYAFERVRHEKRITLKELDDPGARARIGAEIMREIATRLPREWPKPAKVG